MTGFRPARYLAARFQLAVAPNPPSHLAPGDMELVCYVALGCLLALVLLYGLLELHYFLRMCLCVLLARFVKRRCHILETTTVNGRFALPCSPRCTPRIYHTLLFCGQVCV